ncbi:hypothetical protein FALCPG4_018250 [Fusarium falciforme]
MLKSLLLAVIIYISTNPSILSSSMPIMIDATPFGIRTQDKPQCTWSQVQSDFVAGLDPPCGQDRGHQSRVQELTNDLKRLKETRKETNLAFYRGADAVVQINDEIKAKEKELDCARQQPEADALRQLCAIASECLKKIDPAPLEKLNRMVDDLHQVECTMPATPNLIHPPYTTLVGEAMGGGPEEVEHPREAETETPDDLPPIGGDQDAWFPLFSRDAPHDFIPAWPGPIHSSGQGHEVRLPDVPGDRPDALPTRARLRRPRRGKRFPRRHSRAVLSTPRQYPPRCYSYGRSN